MRTGTIALRPRVHTTAAAAAVAAALGVLSDAPSTIAPFDVVTHHNDNARTGQHLNEETLTRATVNSGQFGKVGFFPVDGKVDAQPLYVGGVAIPGQGLRNVLYVATELNSVYALNADTGATIWQTSMLSPGETTSDTRSCGQVTPQIGVTSTPVIDRTRGTHGIIYLVAMSKDRMGEYFQRLHALDLATGAELLGGPTTVQASAVGAGAGNVGGLLSFDPQKYKARSALLLHDGTVYTTWAPHCDMAPYTGWVISFDAATLARKSVLNVTPNGAGGGVWAPSGPAADAAGNLYARTGNGTFDTVVDPKGFPWFRNFGNALVKIATTGPMTVTDYFTPYDTTQQSALDLDLGSGGPILLPDLTDSQGSVRRLAVSAGTDTQLYVFDRDRLGQWHATRNDVYQELPKALAGPMFSTPAYFDRSVYVGAVNDSIKAFRIPETRLDSTPATQTADTFPYPGATPSISANGAAEAILWAVSHGSPAVLFAFDARDLTHKLYDSSQAGTRDWFGAGSPFVTPTIANGRVFVGTPSGIAVFGLLPGSPDRQLSFGSSTTSLTTTLEWDAPTTGPAPTEYVVEAGTAPGLSDLGSESTGSNVPRVTFATPSIGIYYLRVRSRNQRGTSAPSNEVMLTVGPPGPPPNLAATWYGPAIVLSWSAPNTGGVPKTYVIEAGLTPGTTIATREVGANDTIFVAFAGSGLYYVRVRATNDFGPGAPSSEIVVVVP